MALTLDSDEAIIYEVRRHWFIFSIRTIGILLLLFFPLFLYSIIKVLPITLTAEGNIHALLLFIYSLWVLLSWFGAMILWTDYYLDVMILTNKRLIRVEQNGLFSRGVSYLDLKKIEDVKSNVDGIIATSLGFGDLSVQSAASNREFVMHYIAEPLHLRDRITQAISDYEKEHSLEKYISEKSK